MPKFNFKDINGIDCYTFARELMKQNSGLAYIVAKECDTVSRMEDVRIIIAQKHSFSKLKDISDNDVRDIASNANEIILDNCCDWEDGVIQAINMYIENEFEEDEEE